jgi:hypothetical protein
MALTPLGLAAGPGFVSSVVGESMSALSLPTDQFKGKVPGLFGTNIGLTSGRKRKFMNNPNSDFWRT